MMMIKRYYLLTIFFLLVPFLCGELRAQYSDFQNWTDVDITGDVSPKLSAKISFSQRFMDNISRFDRSHTTGSLEYEVFDNFELEGGYRYSVVNDIENGIESRHRFHADASYGVNWIDLEFTLRGRLQYNADDLSRLSGLYNNDLTHRLKGKITYDIFGKPVELYASWELFFPLGRFNLNLVEEVRAEAGMEYMLSQKSDIRVGYLMSSEKNQVNPLRAHIIRITFQYAIF